MSRVVLFVYGTLMPGQRAHDQLTGPGSGYRSLGRACTTPSYTLLHLGAYPGLLDAGNTAVHGALVELELTALPALDVYEGDQYHRLPVRLAPPHDALPAQAWVLVRPIAAPPIASGDWLTALPRREP